MSTSSERTAQDAWKEMLRDHVGPALRRMGWRGGASRWELDDEVSFALLGFQKSRGSNRSEISFTINLSVLTRTSWEVQRAAWGERAPSLPQPGILYGRDGWRSRIGHVLPANRDTWWSITPETELAAFSEALVRQITEYAAPAMHKQLWVRSELAAGREIEPELLMSS